MFKPISTLVFWIVFMGSGLVMQVALGMSWVLAGNLDTRQKLAQRQRLLWSAMNLNWFFGVPPLSDIRSSTSELPGQFILVSNHRSNLDPLFVFVVGRPLFFLSKKSVLKTPIIGWWMRLCGDVPVERGEKASREKSLAAMRERLQRGDSLLIFPEGTRQTDPQVELGAFKDGAFNLASQTGVPIVLLVLNNSDKVWEKGSLFLKLQPLRYQISSPIVSSGRSAESLKAESIEKMKEMVQSLRV
jgi:1-acyl-sn-glycerol-3-phosphate acyltransferase